MEVQKNITCIACKEEIKEGATICPHCGKPQSHSHLHLVGNVLKWAAGITALLTLVISGVELNKIVDRWLSQQNTANEYVDAARFLLSTGDHVNSQELLQQALTIDPSSSKARDLRIEIAMKNIRSFSNLNWEGNQIQQIKNEITESAKNYVEFQYYNPREDDLGKLNINELIPLFARGVVSAVSTYKSSLLAHLAWMDTLRDYGKQIKYDVDGQFIRALDVDPSNHFANAMYGAWQLSSRYSVGHLELDLPQRIAKSHFHFEKALKSNKDRDWILALWQDAFVRASVSSDDKQYNHLLIREEFNFYQMLKNEDHPLIEGRNAFSILRKFIWAGGKGSQRGPSHEEEFQELLKAFPASELLNKLNWSSEEVYGCKPGEQCENGNNEMQSLVYISGRLHELENNLDQAIDMYRIAQSERFEFGFCRDHTIEQLKEIMAKKGMKTTSVLVINSTILDPIQDHDVVLAYNGKSVRTEDELESIYQGAEENSKAAYSLLRSGHTIEVEAKHISRNSVKVSVVPESLLASDKYSELSAWISGN